ncbi:MAG: thioredoxin domain-containing protein [Gemmatimonadota bacterium]|nr:thioredoxin domain-containing protein [Gemmatimonadota bacterium]
MPSAPQVLNVILATGAILVTLALVRRTFWPFSVTPPPQVVVDPGWREYRLDERGQAEAEAEVVDIIEFTDYSCPFCKLLASALDTVLNEHGNRVRWTVRYFPLEDRNPAALAAAIAAECARRQGAFKAYHDVLFENQSSFGQVPWVELAFQVGLVDTLRFSQCLTGGVAAAVVRRDQAAGRMLGIRGTPTFLVNDRKVTGYMPSHTIDSLIKVVRDER